jgi:hypothetical protein
MLKLCWRALLGLSLGGLALAQAREFWATKDYKQWSEKECRKLMENSPWASDYTLKDTHVDSLQDSGSFDRGRQSSTTLGYQVQFRSARPMRQAVARQMMIETKYDQMAPEQKQDLDARIGKFLAADFSDKILVHVIYKSNVPQTDRDLARYWQTRTLDTIKNTTNLIVGDGRKIPPTGFVAAGGGVREFQFVFPRRLNGQPAVSPKDKTLKIEFLHPNLSSQGEIRVLLTFKPEQMTINGEAVY